MESRVIMWSRSPERTREGRLSPTLESSAGAVRAAVGVFLVVVVVVVLCVCVCVCVCAHAWQASSTFHLAEAGRWALAQPPLTIARREIITQALSPARACGNSS